MRGVWRADIAGVAIPIVVALVGLLIGLYVPYRFLRRQSQDRGSFPVLFLTCFLTGVALSAAAFQTYEGIREVTTALANSTLESQTDTIVGAIVEGLVQAGLLVGLAAGVYLVGLHVLARRAAPEHGAGDNQPT